MAKSNAKKKTVADHVAAYENEDPTQSTAATANDAEPEKPFIPPAVAGFSGEVDVSGYFADSLHTWEGNVRQQKDPAFMAELEASIRQYGVLTSLVVRRSAKGGFEVLAGEQRLQAVKALIARGELPENTTLPCRVIDCTDEEAREVSLAENVVRQQLSPADEFEAFQKMAADGATVAEIAHKFGCGDSTVKKRLQLANVSPRVIKDFRDGKVTLNQLQAMAISEDHAAQESFADQNYSASPETIRTTLQKGKVSAADKRVKFVGLDAIEAAGVKIIRDLFEPEKSYVEDVKGLNKLVQQKMEQAAAELKAEGWSFVESVSGGVFTWTTNEKYAEIPSKKVSLSTADKKTRDDLQAKVDAYYDSDKNPSDGEHDAIMRMEEQIEEIEDKQNTWDAAAKAKGGAIFSIGDAGQLVIRRGLKLKPVKKADKDGEDSAAAGSGQKKEKSPAEKKGMTGDVMELLTTHRSKAIGAEIAQNHEIGFRLGAALLIGIYFGSDLQGGYTDDILGYSDGDLMPSRIPYDVDEKKNKFSGHEWLERREKEVLKLLPKKRSEIAKWCIEAKLADLQPIIAFIAGVVYDDTNETGDARKETTDLVEALGVDFGDWYVPTADNLFGNLGQEQLQRMVKEIRGTDLTPAELKLGKEALAQLAEREAKAADKAGRTWLPYPLAQKEKPEAKKPAAAKPAATKPAAKKKAAAKKSKK